eukprot:365660-Chlamydomonas_euryale.AAC.8
MAVMHEGHDGRCCGTGFQAKTAMRCVDIVYSGSWAVWLQHDARNHGVLPLDLLSLCPIPPCQSQSGLLSLCPIPPMSESERLDPHVSPVIRPPPQTPEEKLAARKDMAAGPLKARLDCLVKLLSRSGGDFCVGSTLTYADFALFGALCMLTSGFLDGVPTDALEPYPELKAFHGRFAALPAIAKMYESATGLHASCKALPAAT